MLHILSTLNLSKVAHCDYGNAWLQNSAYLAYLTISARINFKGILNFWDMFLPISV